MSYGIQKCRMQKLFFKDFDYKHCRMQQDKFIQNEKNILETAYWMKYFLYFCQTVYLFLRERPEK